MSAAISPQHSAGHWFLHSGIQNESGGVARYYRSDLQQNARTSTEITGYAVSTFIYLFETSGDRAYLDAAIRAAKFLTGTAWNPEFSAFPFEHGEAAPSLTYFFDTGIIIRGLLALWRVNADPELLRISVAAGTSLHNDFVNGTDIHPILTLPGKRPIERTSQWSRNSGCYQLKSALAWHDLYETTGERHFLNWYTEARLLALGTHDAFLPAETDELTMDRLHAYAYFLEGLLPVAHEVTSTFETGLARIGKYLRDIAPTFERSDVYAQLLRARVLSNLPFHEGEAEYEARQIETFQRSDGGFWFGRKQGEFLPYINPVSTSFCFQALDVRQHRRNVSVI